MVFLFPINDFCSHDSGNNPEWSTASTALGPNTFRNSCISSHIIHCLSKMAAKAIAQVLRNQMRLLTRRRQRSPLTLRRCAPTPLDEKNMNKIQIMNNAARIATLSSIAMTACLLVYLRKNTSGHTGFSLYFALLVFAPSALLGAANMMTTRAIWKNPWAGIIPTMTGVLGTALLIYLDKANVLLQYDTWLNRGMP